MLKPVGRIAIRTAVSVGMLLAGAVPAMAEPTPATTPGGGAEKCEVNMICEVVTDPGGTPRPGGGGGGGGGGGPRVCTWNGENWPCQDPELGWFNSSDGCYYDLADPQPPAGDPAWEGHGPSDGAVYDTVCRSTGGGIGAPVPRFFATAPAGPPPDDPAAMAGQLVRDVIRFRAPAPGLAPRGPAVVTAPVWLWLDQSAGPVVPAARSVTGRTLTVTVTPRLDRVVWDFGSGGEVVCRTVGTPYEARHGAQRSPDCGHVFTASSARTPDGSFHGTVTVHWSAHVTVSDGRTIAPIPVDQSSAVALRVAEVQALN